MQNNGIIVRWQIITIPDFLLFFRCQKCLFHLASWQLLVSYIDDSLCFVYRLLKNLKAYIFTCLPEEMLGCQEKRLLLLCHIFSKVIKSEINSMMSHHSCMQMSTVTLNCFWILSFLHISFVKVVITPLDTSHIFLIYYKKEIFSMLEFFCLKRGHLIGIYF